MEEACDLSVPAICQEDNTTQPPMTMSVTTEPTSAAAADKQHDHQGSDDDWYAPPAEAAADKQHDHQGSDDRSAPPAEAAADKQNDHQCSDDQSAPPAEAAADKQHDHQGSDDDWSAPPAEVPQLDSTLNESGASSLEELEIGELSEPSEQSGQRLHHANVSVAAETEPKRQIPSDIWTTLLQCGESDQTLSNTKVVHVYLSWSDGTNSSGVKWKMCNTICKSALNAIKDHVMTRHNCSVQEKVDISTQWEEGTTETSGLKAESSGQKAGPYDGKKADSDKPSDAAGQYTCRSPRCAQQFDMKSELLQHESRMHNNGYVFQCPHCNKSFSRQSFYNRHLLIHTKAQQCKMCRKVFRNKQALFYHQKMKHGRRETSRRRRSAKIETDVTIKPSEVNVKGIKLEPKSQTESGLGDVGGCESRSHGDVITQEHSGLHHDNNSDTDENEVIPRRPRRIKWMFNFKCSICCYKCKKKNELTRHMATHDDEHFYPCESCEVVCKSITGLQRHIKYAHGGIKNETKNEGTSRERDREQVQSEEDSEDDASNGSIDDSDEDYDADGDEASTTMDLELPDRHGLTEDSAKSSADVVVKIRALNSDEESGGAVSDDNAAENEKMFKCDVCHKSFGRSYDLQCHMVTHNRRVQQKCSLCWKMCKNVVGLRRHMKRAHPGTKQPSLIQDTDSVDDLQCHMVTHNRQVQQKCSLCWKMCKNVVGLRRHMKRAHPGIKQPSLIRDAVDDTGSYAAEEDDDKTPTDDDGSMVRYPCRSTDCKEAFTMLHQRVQHEKEQHDGKPLECKICFKTFGSQCHYARHMGVHTEQQTCSVCKKVCKNANSLRKHQLLHINGGAMCQFCGKTFHDKASMKTHEKIHTNDKQYKCDYCEKRFIKSSDKRIHEQRHTGFQFVCMHCGHGCATKALLENHEAIHTGVKPYECDECHRKFRTAGQLYNHKPLHTGGRFECQMCTKRFRWKCDLKTHTRIHLGERPHKCDNCDKRFVDVSNKLAHMKQVHLGIKRTGHGKKGKSKQSVHRSVEGSIQRLGGAVQRTDNDRQNIHRSLIIDGSGQRRADSNEDGQSVHKNLDINHRSTADSFDDRVIEGTLQRPNEDTEGSIEINMNSMDSRSNLHRATDDIDSRRNLHSATDSATSRSFHHRSVNLESSQGFQRTDDVRARQILHPADIMRPSCSTNTYGSADAAMVGIGKPLQTFDGTPVSSAPLYPTMLPHRGIPGGEHRLPRGDHPSRPSGHHDDSSRPPHNDFYSMVQTLIQFSKDS